MGAEAARAPWRDAAASQSIPVQDNAPSPRHTNSSAAKNHIGFSKTWACIGAWYFNPQVVCGGRSHHQQASRDRGPLHMQKGFLVHWTERLGRGEETRMKLNPEETGQQYVRGRCVIDAVGKWLAEDLDVIWIVIEKFSVLAVTSYISMELGTEMLCGYKCLCSAILRHCWHLQNLYLIL